MGAPTRDDAAALAGARGAGSDTRSDDDTYRITTDPTAGKAVAVWLYCLGARSLRETDAAFRRHPAWRSA